MSDILGAVGIISSAATTTSERAAAAAEAASKVGGPVAVSLATGGALTAADAAAAAAAAEAAGSTGHVLQPLEVMVQLYNLGIVMPTTSSGRSALGASVKHLLLALPGGIMPDAELAESGLEPVLGMMKEAVQWCVLVCMLQWGWV